MDDRRHALMSATGEQTSAPVTSADAKHPPEGVAIEWPDLPAPLGTRSLRTHPLAPYGRQRPGETPLRTALSPRYLIRPPWPGAATRDENRTACPAKLGSRCGRARWYGRFSFQDEAGGSSPPRPTKRPLTRRNAGHVRSEGLQRRAVRSWMGSRSLQAQPTALTSGDVRHLRVPGRSGRPCTGGRPLTCLPSLVMRQAAQSPFIRSCKWHLRSQNRCGRMIATDVIVLRRWLNAFPGAHGAAIRAVHSHRPGVVQPNFVLTQ
jgi:hypothetical protein